MELEKQVCSLGLAKRLKELEVKQESLFYWNNARLSSSNPYWLIEFYGGDGQGDYSAFTSAELGGILPKGIQSNKLDNSDPRWICCSLDKNHDEIADTEAEARAKMLIYLLENNLI